MKKAKRLFIIVFNVVFTTIIYFLFFPNTSFAVSVTISDVPSTITTDPFTLTASVSGAQAGVNYLKIDLYKDGQPNYFGETNTPQGWYGGSDGLQTYPITIIANAPWSGQIQGRLGNPTTTQFDGTGIYKLRVRRYTGSGSSYITSESVVVTIAVPTLTPTPTVTPTPTNEPTPTRTPTPTKTPTPTPMKDEEENTPTPIKSVKKVTPTAILGTSTQSAVFEIPTATPIEMPTPTITVAVESSKDNLPFFSIMGGALFLISYAILKLQPWLKSIWKKE